MKKSEQLKAQMQEKWDAIKALQGKVTAENREYSAEERGLIEKTLDEIRPIELAIDEERKSEALAARIGEVDKLFTGGAAAPQPQQRPQATAKQQGGSLGNRFVNSEVWQKWLRENAPNGQIPSSLRNFSTPPIDIKDFGIFERKELITGVAGDSAGAWIIPDQSGIYEQIGRYPLSLRQLIDVRQTTSDTVEWVRQTKQASEAIPVAESNVTTFTGSTGEISGEKPEITVNWERYSATVKTIAAFAATTTRAASDVSQLIGLINSELREDVNEELENQLLNGNGIGENFTGLANTADVLVQAFVTDIAQTARRAITNLLINGRQIPTAWLLNPQDWEAFDLLQDLNGRYYWGGPMAQGPRTLWGVPVAQSFFLAQGTGWLANWKKMVLWDRQQATIAMSDSHDDFFRRNMLALRADLRAAMGVIRPTAFVEVDLDAS